jgi:hypothetical protein
MLAYKHDEAVASKRIAQKKASEAKKAAQSKKRKRDESEDELDQDDDDDDDEVDDNDPIRIKAEKVRIDLHPCSHTENYLFSWTVLDDPRTV